MPRNKRLIGWVALWERHKQHKMLRLGLLVLTPIAALLFSLLVFVLVLIGIATVAWLFVGCPTLWAQETSTKVIPTPSAIYCVIQETTQLTLQGTKITGTFTTESPAPDHRKRITVIGKARCWQSKQGPHGRSIAQIIWSHIKLPDQVKAYPIKRPLTMAIYLPRCEVKQSTRLKIKDPDHIIHETLLDAACNQSEEKTEKISKYQKILEPTLSRDRRVEKEEGSFLSSLNSRRSTPLGEDLTQNTEALAFSGPDLLEDSERISSFPKTNYKLNFSQSPKDHLVAESPTDYSFVQKPDGSSNIKPPSNGNSKDYSSAQTKVGWPSKPIVSCKQDPSAPFQPSEIPEVPDPEPIPDSPKVEVEITSNGCMPRIDEPHDRVIIQTRSISRQNGKVIHETECNDTEKVFPLNKDYQCQNCQDDIRLNQRVAFARYQKYWIDEEGQRQYIKDRLYVDETSPYQLVDDPGDCTYDIDWQTEKSYTQVERVYFDRTNTRKVVQACHRKVSQAPYDIKWTHQGCGLTHDFVGNQSRELQRAVFNKDGVEHEARSCRPRGEALPHQFITSVCEPIRDVDGRQITQMARRKVKTSLGEKFITQTCQPHGSAIPLHSTPKGCRGEYVHDWDSGRSYTKIRWYHNLRGSREYVTSCLRSNTFFRHRRKVVGYSHDDKAKLSRAKTVIYIKPSKNQRLEISHPQIRDEDPLPYTQVDTRIQALEEKATQDDCYRVIIRASFAIYRRADGSEYAQLVSRVDPQRVYNCREEWEYITRVGGGGGTTDGGWARAMGVNYRRKVIYYPDGKFHSKGNWQKINAY